MIIKFVSHSTLWVLDYNLSKLHVHVHNRTGGLGKVDVLQYGYQM